MLFGPATDSAWSLPRLAHRRRALHWTLALAVAMVALVAVRPAAARFALGSVFLVGLPEEWFFRAYFMERIGKGWGANLVASGVFALLHTITRGPVVGLKVFAPSLLFGWLYQRTRYLPLVVVAHGASNVIYHLYLAEELGRLTHLIGI